MFLFKDGKKIDEKDGRLLQNCALLCLLFSNTHISHNHISSFTPHKTTK